MYNDSWIYLIHEKRLYSKKAKDIIQFCIDCNAETEKVFADFSISVWNEHGILLIENVSTGTTTQEETVAGFFVRNIPEDRGHFHSASPAKKNKPNNRKKNKKIC